MKNKILGRGSFEVSEPGRRLKGWGGKEVESGGNKRENQYNSPVRIGALGNRVHKSFKNMSDGLFYLLCSSLM